MIHRHLEYPRDTPAEELPSAAIVDILERGDLRDWRPIASAVARDPSGALADRVLRLLEAFPMYGTSRLWRSWVSRCRDRAEGREGRRTPACLSALRRSMGLTQVELARRIGMTQSDLSKLERRRDVRVSTLSAFARALDGRLRIMFDADGEKTEIRVPGD